jgi:hypothetical protein
LADRSVHSERWTTRQRPSSACMHWHRRRPDGVATSTCVVAWRMRARPAPGVDGDRWSGPAAAGRADASAPCKRGHRDANREIESNTSVRGTLRRVWPRGSMRWLMVMARWAGQSAGSRPVAHPGTTTIDGDGDHRTSLSSARAFGCSPAPPQSESPTATACLAARIIMLLHPRGTQSLIRRKLKVTRAGAIRLFRDACMCRYCKITSLTTFTLVRSQEPFGFKI